MGIQTRVDSPPALWLHGQMQGSTVEVRIRLWVSAGTAADFSEGFIKLQLESKDMLGV